MNEKDPLQNIFPILNLPPLKYLDLIKSHQVSNNKKKNLKVKILTNITLSPLKEILELTLWNNKLDAEVTFGEYDNIIQESLANNQNDCTIIFWELWNFFQNAAPKLECMSKKDFIALQKKLKTDLVLVFESLKSEKLVLINRFANLPYSRYDGFKNRLNELVDFGNKILEDCQNENLRLIETNQIHYMHSISKTLDTRYLYSAKSIYTHTFYRHYACIVCMNILKTKGNIKKVLVLDCDNTLWKGVLGEDGINGIDMSSDSPSGSVFNEVQLIFKSLKKKGILICLCTKNNNEDIEAVIDNHPDLIINSEDLVYISANWEPKPDNLIKMSKSLNLGLDSFVFIDDSDFEIGLMREKLPEVTSLKVPEKISDYPSFALNVGTIFESHKLTEEDENRTAMYKSQILRDNELKNSVSLDTYLKSLNMCLYFYLDSEKYLNRLSKMTQKTNQFNLTTIRMTESDVQKYINSSSDFVICSSLTDRFGDSGVTAACFISFKEKKIANIDNLLLSCRVLGRNVEFSFLEQIIKEVSKRGAVKLLAKYIPSSKNKQVSNFYENFNFEKIKIDKNETVYKLDISKFKTKDTNYIKCIKE